MFVRRGFLLQSLIGLSSVKAEVERLTNFIKIMKVREKHGVLFIDEAYSLVNGGNNDYGTEAVSTLSKRVSPDINRVEEIE